MLCLLFKKSFAFPRFDIIQISFTVIKDNSEIKKVLIGPYVSRAQAKKDLLKIRKTIKKDAFITRIP